MSRIGAKPVPLPSGVKITQSAGRLLAEGGKGKLELVVHPGIQIKVDDAARQCIVSRENDLGNAKALHGLTRALLANILEGVTSGYQRILEVHGVGYTAKVQGDSISLALGYCDPRVLKIPAGLKVTCAPNAQDKNVTDITITGIDKQLVGQFASVIRSQRTPEPYKQKGVRYRGEVIIKKAGKVQAG